MNLTTTVGQIIDYVTLSAPIDGSFQLLSGFPPKPLENPSQTVQQAELQGSAVIQKLI